MLTVSMPVSLVSFFFLTVLLRVLLSSSTVVFGISGMGWSLGGRLPRCLLVRDLPSGTLSIGVLVVTVGGLLLDRTCWPPLMRWISGPL